MPLRDLIGQHRAVALLQAGIATGRGAHAYLFHGPDGAGADAAALAFTQLLLCPSPVEGDACGVCRHCRRILTTPEAPDGAHPDVLHLRQGQGEGSAKSRITIEQIRAIQQKLCYAPLEGPVRAVIIHDADSLAAGRGESANALLKTLEEPPDRTVLILVASSPMAVLETIRSRCRLIPFTPPPVEDLAALLRQRHGLPPAEARRAASLSGGDLERALLIARGEEGGDRDEALTQWLDPAVTPVELMAGMEALVQRGEDAADNRERLEEVLTLLFTLYRDVLAVAHHLEETGVPLLNEDLLPLLRPLAERVSPAAVYRFLDRLDYHRRSVGINVSVPGVMEAVVMDALRLAVR